jgi:hypothetical protein
MAKQITSDLMRGNTDIYQITIMCTHRDTKEKCRYIFPTNSEVHHIHSILLKHEGVSFDVESLVELGELTTINHKLTYTIESCSNVARPKAFNTKYLLAMGIKYLLCSGYNYDKAVEIMRGYSSISNQDKVDLWHLITCPNFADKAELLAYTA